MSMNITAQIRWHAPGRPPAYTVMCIHMCVYIYIYMYYTPISLSLSLYIYIYMYRYTSYNTIYTYMYITTCGKSPVKNERACKCRVFACVDAEVNMTRYFACGRLLETSRRLAVVVVVVVVVVVIIIIIIIIIVIIMLAAHSTMLCYMSLYYVIYKH